MASMSCSSRSELRAIVAPMAIEPWGIGELNEAAKRAIRAVEPFTYGFVSGDRLAVVGGAELYAQRDFGEHHVEGTKVAGSVSARVLKSHEEVPSVDDGRSFWFTRYFTYGTRAGPFQGVLIHIMLHI